MPGKGFGKYAAAASDIEGPQTGQRAIRSRVTGEVSAGLSPYPGNPEFVQAVQRPKRSAARSVDALAVCFQDVDAMCESVQQSSSEALVAHHFDPVLYRLLLIVRNS